MSDLEIRPITAVYSPPYKNIEYQKTTIRIVNNQQIETVFTYNKYGNLIETVIKNHEIASV